MFTKKTIAAAILALGALTAAAPANAGGVTVQFGGGYYGDHHGRPGWHQGRPDWHHDHRDRVTQRDVRRILYRNGFDDIRWIDRQGRVFVARAEDRRGRDVRVVVSARSGAIIDVDRIGRRG